MAQFVLVNVVVAVLMKHLEESNKVRIVKVTTLMGFNTVVVDRNIQNCLFLLQEAKEEAEMDAEIALEMSMEQQRRLSTTSSRSSVEGTYVGPCPHSPGQVGQNTVILLNGCLSTKLRHELPTVARVHLNNHRKSLLSSGLCLPLQDEELHCTSKDQLSPRKMSVSRMHSLPNDSYMFRPVRPASAPYPLEEVEHSPQHQHSGK